MEPSDRTLKRLWQCFESGSSGETAVMLCAMVRQGLTRPLTLFQDHPLADEWTDFASEAISAHLRKRKGIVYVVVNPMNPKFFKIGVTGSNVDKRLKSLKTAGVVGEFIEVDHAEALDRYAAEAVAHRQMESLSTRHKEFFVTDHATASRVMRASVEEDNRFLSAAFRDQIQEPLIRADFKN